MNKALKLVVAEVLVYSKERRILKKKDQFKLTIESCNKKGIRVPSYSTFVRVRTSILEESCESNMKLESLLKLLKEPEGSPKNSTS
jgi:hypothetical protein